MGAESPEEYKGQHIEKTFLGELTHLVNEHSQENASNTPDYLLAQYLVGCLRAFETAVEQREKWHGRDPKPSHTRYGVEIKVDNVSEKEELNIGNAEGVSHQVERIVRLGDLSSMAMMDCPVFLLQEYIMECNENDEIVNYWKTVDAWFTRQEVENWAEAHHYRLGIWRVYGVGARGQLKTLLKSHTDYAEQQDKRCAASPC